MRGQTLTQDLSVPPVGTAQVRTYYANFSASGLATSGTGNTWDGTAATAFGVVNSVAYRAPGDSPFAAQFPSTTLCMLVNAGTADEEWRHYHVDATIAELLGTGTDVFDGGRTFCTFPFNLGDSFTDSYSINGGPPTGETDEYVASGSITAPWGTIPDVVMFSVNSGASYYFYTADNVLDAIGSYTPGFGLDLWQVELTVGVPERTTTRVAVWPSPAVDAITVSHGFDGLVNISILDATGRTVLARSTGDKQVRMDLQGLKAGAYVVSVSSARGERATRVLQVQ